MDISVINKERVMVIIRHDGLFDVIGLFSAVESTGIHAIEITLNTPEALNMIKKASKHFESKMIIGAGTVLTIDDVKGARNAGARFIVSPVFNKSVVEFSVKENLPVFPGVSTPSEMYDAVQAGAHMVKLFPASQFSPSYIKSVKAPLPHIPILAVGGITPENVGEYLFNGADAVAIGGGII